MALSSNAEFATSLLGDHPALNLLNTVWLVEGELVDALQSDQDVVRWLGQSGWRVAELPSTMRSSALLEAARTLRDTVRSLVESRKAGKRLDVSELNRWLAEARNYIELHAKRDGSLQMERRWEQRTPRQILAPLAESAADLLLTGDFDLVKRCESSECVLWFYDRTRSHHRRWCSMATCGNRHKVTAFRRRQEKS